MKILSKCLALMLAAGLALTSCSKEEGCTDPIASNYNVDAEKDCCCEYDTSSNNEVVSGAITSDETWTSDKIWELNGRVWVENSATLTIEPGTIIKGRQGEGANASALIIAKGANIIAEGTSSSPIIFTSVLDNIEIGETFGTNLNQFDRGKWGGIIVLGNAPVSAQEGDDVAQIEGLPADQSYGAYGGTDVSDNSGILRYISIRHGGILIGEGNEINGLTLGGVGNGTTIDKVEVVGNVDDGIEFFGGSVDVTNALVAFQGDDGIDIDQNYSGEVDNFLVIHGVDTDEALEIDGPEGTLSDGLFSLLNGTIISTDGVGSAADLKSKAQGNIQNMTCWGYSADKYLKFRESFENNCTGDKTDAYDYYTNGSLTLLVQNCEFEGSTGLTIVYTGSEDNNGDDCPVDAALQNTAQNQFNSDNHLTGASAPTTGANSSAFDNWTWSHENGLY
jgi:hypothetical protein